jgi:hypothetical protein
MRRFADPGTVQTSTAPPLSKWMFNRSCYVKLEGEWRILRTGYKRLLEMIGPLDPQWSITSQPIN